MEKKDLKKLALLGISGGVLMASQTNVNADEPLFNTVPGNYIAQGCSSCGGATAYNGRGYSNQGYFYNQDQNQTYYYQQAPDESYRVEQNTRRSRNQNSQSDQNSYYQYNQNQNPNQNQYYYQSNYNDGYLSANDPITKQSLTESQLQAQLSPQSKIDYSKLSPEGKATALKIVNEGTASPDEAVKIASLKDKRSNLNGSSN